MFGLLLDITKATTVFSHEVGRVLSYVHFDLLIIIKTGHLRLKIRLKSKIHQAKMISSLEVTRTNMQIPTFPTYFF